MKKLLATATFLFAAAIPLGCGKVYNSSSYDASTYGSATGTAQFIAAKQIINTSCANCHTRPSHQSWAGMSEKEFIAQGLISPGNLAGSQLYTKILGNRTGIAGNMPDGGSPLTSTELTTLETWIQSATP